LAPQQACTAPAWGGASTHMRNFALDSLHMAGWAIANAIHDCAAPGVSQVSLLHNSGEFVRHLSSEPAPFVRDDVQAEPDRGLDRMGSRHHQFDHDLVPVPESAAKPKHSRGAVSQVHCSARFFADRYPPRDAALRSPGAMIEFLMVPGAPTPVAPFRCMIGSRGSPLPKTSLCLAGRGLGLLAGLGALAARLQRRDDLTVGCKRLGRRLADVQHVAW
jgi:hypothetical protein